MRSMQVSELVNPPDGKQVDIGFARAVGVADLIESVPLEARGDIARKLVFDAGTEVVARTAMTSGKGDAHSRYAGSGIQLSLDVVDAQLAENREVGRQGIVAHRIDEGAILCLYVSG